MFNLLLHYSFVTVGILYSLISQNVKSGIPCLSKVRNGKSSPSDYKVDNRMLKVKGLDSPSVAMVNAV